MRKTLLTLLVAATTATLPADEGCKTMTFGKSCGPAHLATRVIEQKDGRQEGVIWVGGVKSGHACIVVGKKKIKMRLPGSDCILMVEPAVMIPAMTNAKGEFDLHFLFPRKFEGSCMTQAVLLDPATNKISVTNGARFTCDD